MQRLDNYFEKCIKEAHEAEQREYNPDRVKWFYIVVENQILFDIRTPYDRVSRRAVSRINNNVWKNFKLNNNGDYFIDDILQLNFVRNKYTIGKKDIYLCKAEEYSKMKRGEVIPSYRYEQLCKAYHDVSTEQFRDANGGLHIPYDINWSEYREIHKKAFGEYPEVKVEYLSKTLS